jgi:hypothetical protein
LLNNNQRIKFANDFERKESTVRGLGSGRDAGDGKDTTSHFCALDVRHLQRKKLLEPGCSFTWQWSGTAGVIASIEVRVEGDLAELEATAQPIELGQILFVANLSCLYPTYIRGQAFLAEGQGSQAATEFQKILDHSGIVWNCWTGALARLGVARANALQAKNSTGPDADAARVSALTAYKDFLTLWKDADPDIPIYKEAKAEYAKLR